MKPVEVRRRVLTGPQTLVDDTGGTDHAVRHRAGRRRAGGVVTLVHYTCAHSIDAIHSQGLVSPTPQPVLGNRLMSWWTDITWPTTRESLGLASHLLLCDRMQYRVEAEDTSQIVPWTKLAHGIPWDVRRFLEGTGTLPSHWFVAESDVPIRTVTRTEEREEQDS